MPVLLRCGERGGEAEPLTCAGARASAGLAMAADRLKAGRSIVQKCFGAS